MRTVEEELSLSAAQVDELVRSGALPVVRILDVWRVESAALDRLIEEARERARLAAGPPVARAVEKTEPGPAGRRTPPEPAPAARCPPADDDLPADGQPTGVRPAALARLTAQQRRVLALVGLGLSNSQVAERLTVEVSTVKSHVQRLLRALDLPDRGHLIAYAWQTGLLHPPGAH
ncbi:response regulator transcription factor [Cellulomonas sp. P5_C5]